MRLGKRLLIFSSLFLAMSLAVGIWAIASPTPGSDSDPLVTLSYITEILSSQITAKTDAQVDTKFNQLKDDIQDQLTILESNTYTPPTKYVLVSLSEGQTLSAALGTEIILRIGDASCISPEHPGLIDTTSGSVLDNGESLSANHLYMVTIDERGILAASDSILIIRGFYSIS